LLAPQINAAACKTFKCGSTGEGDNPPCVKFTAGEDDFPVQECSGDKLCSAAGWVKPDDATADGTCSDPTPPPEVKLVPGEICEKKADCFGDDDKIDCAGGKCTTTVKIDDECTGDDAQKICNVDAFCDNGKCAARKDAAADCTQTYECKFGLACANVDDGGNKCVAFNSLDEGAKFDSTLIPNKAGLWLARDFLCKTGFTMEQAGTDPEKRECRKADKSTDETEDALVRSGGDGEECKYTQWNDADPATAKDATDTSKCGFNKDSAGYCSKRKGDQWYTGVFGEVQGLPYADFGCHGLTGYTTCKDLVDGIKSKRSDLSADWTKKNLEVMEAGNGWALYANNDNCVAGSITTGYWQGDKPDFALNFGFASIAAIMMSFSVLVFML